MHRWTRALILPAAVLCAASCSPKKSSDTVIAPPPTTANAAAVIAKAVVVLCSGGRCEEAPARGCRGADVDAQTPVSVIDTTTRHILDELALGPGHTGAAATCVFTLRTAIATTTPAVDLVIGSHDPITMSIA